MEKRKSAKRVSFIAQDAIEGYTFIACYLIGVVRMIFFLNRVSDEGIAHYAYAFELYNILYIISSLAIAKAMSCMVSLRHAKGLYKNRTKIFQYAIVRAVFISIIFAALLFFASNSLSISFLADANVSLALKCLSIALIPAAGLNVIGYYMKGMGMKVPHSVAQILEQIVNLIVTLSVGTVLFRYGSKVSSLLVDDTKKNAYGAAAGALGVFGGAVIGCIFLVVILLLFKSMLHKQKLSDTTKSIEKYKDIALNSEYMAAGIMLSLLFMSVATFINQLFYFHLAKKASLFENYGAFYGKVRLFIYIPILFAILMENTLTGQLKRILKKDDVNYARQRIGQSMKELMCLLIPFAVFLGTVCEPIFRLCFRGQIKSAVSMMHFAVIYIVISGLNAITSAALRGMDKTFILTLNQALACLLEVASFAVFFVKSDKPVWGLVYAMLIGGIALCILNSVFVFKKLKYRQEWMNTFVFPLIAGSIIGVINFVICKFLSGLIGDFFTIMICAILSAFIYMMLIIFTGVLREYELLELPFGKYWCMLGKFFNILK